MKPDPLARWHSFAKWLPTASPRALKAALKREAKRDPFPRTIYLKRLLGRLRVLEYKRNLAKLGVAS